MLSKILIFYVALTECTGKVLPLWWADKHASVWFMVANSKHNLT